MKLSTKAALFSAFLFPGAGLLLLRHYQRAAIFGIPALLAAGYLLTRIWKIAQQIADNLSQEILATGQMALDTSAIANQMHEAISQTPGMQEAQWVFIASWILSIFSSYAVGKSKEQSPSTLSE